MQRRTFLTGAAASIALPVVPQVASAAAGLPAGPVRIIVGFAPGGGTDILARVMAQKLGAMWNTNVIVENRAGATGMIASDYTARQAPDGNTLHMAHINSHALAPALMPHMSYDPLKDFSPIMLVGVTPNLLICNHTQPAKTVKDLVDLCRKNPGKVSFGSAGTGSAQHMALEMFKLRAGITAIHVPYKGSGPMLSDLMAGQVQYSFDTMTAATPHVKSGKLEALAQTRQKRAKSYPNVPTMAESGFPGFEATTWYGLVGPKGMNPAMVKRMNEDMNKVLAMPDVIERFDTYGAEDGGGSADKFGAFMKEEAVKWAKVVKEANVKLEG
jgi:tripartite-type tricarboxylate transporter receptor subunit TctC